MPEECRSLRTRLQIEQCRLLDWAQVAGFIDLKYDDDWPDVIKPHKTALVAMLAQIRTILDQFADLNGKYEDLRPDQTTSQALIQGDVHLQAEYSSLRVNWSKSVKEREHRKGTNHLIRGGIWMGSKTKAGGKNAGEVFSHPRRLVWAWFDAEVFKELLAKLAGYNNYLTELMHGHYLRQLEEATRKTNLEMVLVRSSLDDLKLLTAAIQLQLGHDAIQPVVPVSRVSARANELWQKLIVLKRINVESDKLDEAPERQASAEYESAIEGTKIQGEVEYAEVKAPLDSKSPRSRVSGVYTRPDNDKMQIWIEWKFYQPDIDDETNIAFARKRDVKRVEELVALLQSYKEDKVEFRIPVCLGYFDDGEKCVDGYGRNRFGLVFAKHNQNPNDEVPRSLLNIIATRKCPSLSQRVRIAHSIATFVLYLHAARWLHKGIRSDSIIFSSLDPECVEPYLSGFEYARPDLEGTQTTGSGPIGQNEVYVHPKYQGRDARGTYRKTFDIYSLGVVLLELAYWQSIQEIMGFKNKPPTPYEVKNFRERLLAPNSEPIKDLNAKVGDRFQEAIMSCIEGEKAFGIDGYKVWGPLVDQAADVPDGVDEKQLAEIEEKKRTEAEERKRLEIEMNVTLQRSFMKKVVDNLGAVVL